MATAPDIHDVHFAHDGRNSDGYQIVEPPSDISLFDLRLTWSAAAVDYAGHPAYQALATAPRIVDRVNAMAIFAKSMALVLVKRLINYELIPLDTRTAPGVGGKLRFVAAALNSAIARRVTTRKSATGSPIVQQLDTSGIAVIAMPSERFFEIEAAATPYFATLTERRAVSKAGGDREFDESRSSVGRGTATALFGAIEQVLTESGVLEAAKNYKGRSCRLIDVNPQINDATDGFWRNIFPDLKLTTLPTTAYCHRDASGGDLKAIIYMTDVGPTNGPFSFVLGSQKLDVSRVDDWIGEANDTSGLSGTGLVARQRFAALPKKFRHKCAYGNDVIDGSPLADALQKGLWSITGPKGAIVLFDTKGTHRGGMVVEGERRVITCIIG